MQVLESPVIDNDLKSVPAPHTAAEGTKLQRWRESAAGSEDEASACVCSAAAPACCPHVPGTPLDWWADDTRRASFRIVEGNWTTVTDMAQSHQVHSLHRNRFASGAGRRSVLVCSALPEFLSVVVFPFGSAC